MKIAFFAESLDLNIGTQRILILDLNDYFLSIGVESKINPRTPENYDIHIYAKNLTDIKYKNKINGSIHPSSDQEEIIKKFDFIIVGSIEERESMIKFNKNIFIFPLIEKMYQNLTPKEHIPIDNSKNIIIGYHGNQNHLNHLNIGLKNALERLSKTFRIKFVYTCSNDKEWIQGRPNIKTEFVKWSHNNIIETLYRFDIGVIPNICEITNNKKLDENIKLGIYHTDIKIRYKNKSNIGRLLVLAQCGIPIVADMTPCNMHILGNPDNGFAVLEEDGWYNALYRLCESHELRNKVSKNAYEEVKRLYNPQNWTQRLYDEISKIKKN